MVNPKRTITRKAILKKFILRVLLHIVMLFDSRQKKLKSSDIIEIEDVTEEVENASWNPGEDWKLLKSNSWLNAKLIWNGATKIKISTYQWFTGLQFV